MKLILLHHFPSNRQTSRESKYSTIMKIMEGILTINNRINKMSLPKMKTCKSMKRISSSRKAPKKILQLRFNKLKIKNFNIKVKSRR